MPNCADAIPRPRMDREDHRHPAGDIGDRVEDPQEVVFDVDIRRPMQRQQRIALRLQFQLATESCDSSDFALFASSVSIITLPTRKTFESGTPSLREILDAALLGDEQEIGNANR